MLTIDERFDIIMRVTDLMSDAKHAGIDMDGRSEYEREEFLDFQAYLTELTEYKNDRSR